MITRDITASKRILPLYNATYYVEAPPYTTLPLATSLSVAYKSEASAISGLYCLEWNVSAGYSPQPLMQPLPYIVHVRALETGDTYLVVLPVAGLVKINQLGNGYEGIADLVGGIEAHIESPSAKSYSFDLIKLSGSIGSALKVYYSLYNQPLQLEVDGTGAMVVPGEPGLYVVIAMPQNPSKNPQDYAAAYSRIY